MLRGLSFNDAGNFTIKFYQHVHFKFSCISNLPTFTNPQNSGILVAIYLDLGIKNIKMDSLKNPVILAVPTPEFSDLRA
jgi:hypothetical protein